MQMLQKLICGTKNDVPLSTREYFFCCSSVFKFQTYSTLCWQSVEELHGLKHRATFEMLVLVYLFFEVTTSHSTAWHAKFPFPVYPTFHPLQYKKTTPPLKKLPPLDQYPRFQSYKDCEKRKKVRKKCRRNKKNDSQEAVDLLFRPSCRPSDMTWSGWNVPSARCTRKPFYVPTATDQHRGKAWPRCDRQGSWPCN